MALDGGLHLPFGQRGWSGNEFDEGKEADYLHPVQARAQKRPWNMQVFVCERVLKDKKFNTDYCTFGVHIISISE